MTQKEINKMSTLLKDYNGGIHCLVTEIPDNL